MTAKTVSEYIAALRGAVGGPFYFPSDKERRKAANLRLAREFGVGLADFPADEVQREIGSAYGQLIVMHSLDLTGVCIDNASFVKEARAAEEKERVYLGLFRDLATVRYPEGGYLAEDTAWICPLQAAARWLDQTLEVKVWWEEFEDGFCCGDSEVVALKRVDGALHVWSLPVVGEDDVSPDYAATLFLRLRCIAAGVHLPDFIVERRRRRFLIDDGRNIHVPRR